MERAIDRPTGRVHMRQSEECERMTTKLRASWIWKEGKVGNTHNMYICTSKTREPFMYIYIYNT